MKKLLAILLALMMVLVSVAAFAAGEDGDAPDNETPVTEPSGGGEDGEDAGTIPATPAATTAATAKDLSVATGYDKDSAPNAGLSAAAAQTVTVSKHINITGTGALVPPQKVKFTVGTGTVTNSTTVTSAPAVTISDTEFTEGKTESDLTKTVTINLPAYTGVGVYTYPVTETDTNIAGMKYATDLELKVTVINGEQGLVIAGIALRQKNVKTDTIENDYAADALTVGKTVAGNMGDKSKAFPITVVLTAPSGDKVYGSVGVTITGDGATVKDGSTSITTKIAAEATGWETKTLALSLKDGQSVKFDNLPAGVTYTVIEDTAIDHINGTPTDEQLADPNAYIVENEVTTETELTADTTVTITNTKNIEVDTGVALDSTVYMLIMALALVGFVALKVRRREEN